MESPLVPMLLIGGIMYFLIIRPQLKEKQAHDLLLSGLAKDDEVVTNSGLWGRVVRVDGDRVVLNVGGKSELTFDKHAIGRRSNRAPSE